MVAEAHRLSDQQTETCMNSQRSGSMESVIDESSLDRFQVAITTLLTPFATSIPFPQFFKQSQAIVTVEVMQ